MIQKRFHFTGTVQGVGFRYTACRIANEYAITGYVRNLSDGSVECVVEGPAEEIGAFLDRIKKDMGGYIRRTTEQTAPATGQWREFGMAY